MRRIRRQDIVRHTEFDILICDFCGTKEDVQQLLDVSLMDGEEGMYSYHVDACWNCTYENDAQLAAIQNGVEALHNILKPFTVKMDVIAPNFGYPYPENEYEDEDDDEDN